jgi:predicted nucleic-acid-binding Zn-ribbon protein
MHAHGPTQFNFKCPKCSGNRCEISTVSTAGGFWSKIFDVQHKKFSAVTCERCRYTELYKADSSTLGNIFDLFTN